MPDEPTPQRALSGQVLTPARSETHLPIEPPLRGVPLVNRLRYNAARKELEAYLSVLRLRNTVIGEITTTLELRERYEAALVRTERLNDLRQIANLQIDAELDQALGEAVRRHRDGLALDLARRTQMARLEAEAIEAERYLEAVKNPPPVTPLEPPPKIDRAERIAAEIKRLRRDEKVLIDALMEEAGSEDELTEEDRELILDVKLHTHDQIAKLMGQGR